MKTIYKLAILFLISNFGVYGQSASNKEMVEEGSKKKMNSLAMMAQNLKAYQIKSENKIQEFYNYLNILGKPEVKPELKEQTITAIKKLFKEENIKIPNFFKDATKDILLNDFLNLVAKSNENCSFTVEGFGYSYVQTDNKNQRFWTIGYTLQLEKGKKQYTIRDIMQNVTLLQEEKQFGKNTKTVWSTYLTSVWLK
jgi:hypothetical protein